MVKPYTNKVLQMYQEFSGSLRLISELFQMFAVVNRDIYRFRCSTLVFKRDPSHSWYNQMKYLFFAYCRALAIATQKNKNRYIATRLVLYARQYKEMGSGYDGYPFMSPSSREGCMVENRSTTKSICLVWRVSDLVASSTTRRTNRPPTTKTTRGKLAI